MRRMSILSSRFSEGRPPRARDFKRQNSRKPNRCHPGAQQSIAAAASPTSTAAVGSRANGPSCGASVWRRSAGAPSVDAAASYSPARAENGTGARKGGRGGSSKSKTTSPKRLPASMEKPMSSASHEVFATHTGEFDSRCWKINPRTEPWSFRHPQGQASRLPPIRKFPRRSPTCLSLRRSQAHFVAGCCTAITMAAPRCFGSAPGNYARPAPAGLCCAAAFWS